MYIKEETQITAEHKHSRVDLNRLLLKDKVVGRGRPGSGQPAASLSPYTNTKSWPTVKHKRAMTNTLVMTNTGLVVNGFKHRARIHLWRLVHTSYSTIFETGFLKVPSIKDGQKVKVMSCNPHLGPNRKWAI